MEITNIQDFICPITRQLINQIGITSDGHMYEKSMIEQWLLKNDTSPLTGLIIDKKVYTCLSWQNALNIFYQQHLELASQIYQPSRSHVDNQHIISDIIKDNELTKLLQYNRFDWLLFQVSERKTICKANIQIIRHVIDNMIDLECQSQTIGKWRPIHYACRYGSVATVKLLVEKGVDLECVDNENWRPI